MNTKVEQIYQGMINSEKKGVFVGKKTTADYLGYVLGNRFYFTHMDSCCEYEDALYYVMDNVTADYKGVYEADNVIALSDFVEVLNTSVIPQNRPVALWGGGYELDNEFEVITKYCMPKYIIDKSKTGTYRGVEYVHPDNIDVKNYFIVITTTKYASEIRSILNTFGCKEGLDYILGSNPCLINDNSEMFIHTITDHPIKRVDCRRPFEYVNVGVGGNLTHCCFQWLPKYVGNILDENDGCDSIISRIIRVSFMNCTYSFCNSICCPEMSKEREKLYSDQQVNEGVYLQEQHIKDVDVAFDNTCNLFCESCRTDYLIDKTNEPYEIARNVKNKLVPIAERMTVAGNGEVFLSKAYQSLFEKNYPNLQLIVLSNGNLFSPEKWKLLEGKYKSVHLMFSIDAASKETYEKVRRGGKWENLIRGLRTASELRKKGDIARFVIRFVVSSQNYMEMPAFVNLGIEMGCDCVNFTRIENWGTFSEDEFSKMSMFIGDTPKPEMRNILKLPIMNHSIVTYSNISCD